VFYQGMQELDSGNIFCHVLKGDLSMPDLTSVPDFDNISAFIKERVDAMRAPVPEWADLARLAVQGLPHDALRLAELEAYINAMRAELRHVVIAASEHFSDQQLNKLRKDVGISKYGWRALKKSRPVTTRYGFSLIIY
jgi:hypothetical protein